MCQMHGYNFFGASLEVWLWSAAIVLGIRAGHPDEHIVSRCQQDDFEELLVVEVL